MELKPPLSSTRPIGFLDLPVELRLHIYQYCLVRKDPFIIPHRSIGLEPLSQCRTRDPKNSLLLVSKRVGAEALEVLWGDNFFQIDVLEDRGCHLTGEFWEANRGRIRKLQVVMLKNIYDPCMPDSTPWSPLLAKLTNLVVVVPPPPEATNYPPRSIFNSLSLENWKQWSRKILRSLSSEMRSSCVVEVDDDDDNTETRALMEECFPRGHRKVQTLAGNLQIQGSRYYTGSDYCSGGLDYWNQEIPICFGERHPPCVTVPVRPNHSRDVYTAYEH